jgi:hypothetical protein
MSDGAIRRGRSRLKAGCGQNCPPSNFDAYRFFPSSLRFLAQSSLFT